MDGKVKPTIRPRCHIEKKGRYHSRMHRAAQSRTERRGMVSQVFWTEDRKWAFQRVGNSYNVYNQDGDYERTFTSFWKMCEWIKEGE